MRIVWDGARDVDRGTNFIIWKYNAFNAHKSIHIHIHSENAPVLSYADTTIELESVEHTIDATIEPLSFIITIAFQWIENEKNEIAHCV